MEPRKIALAGFAAFLYTLNVPRPAMKTFAWFALWFITGGRQWFHIFRNTIARDVKGLYGGLWMLFYLNYFKLSKITVVKRFRQVVSWFPDKVLFVNATNDEEWTCRQVEDYSNQVANYFLARGYKKGDTVAFYMTNRPEYIITWLGLAKIGVIPALTNCSIRKSQLVHTIKVAGCRGIVYGLELEPAVAEIRNELLRYYDDGFEFFHTQRGAGLNNNEASSLKGSISLDDKVLESSKDKEPASITKSIGILDSLLYMYTSGTTGLPKAVDFTHLSCAGMFGVQRTDTVYSSLPLYHSSGSTLGISMALCFGVKTVVKKKFSARSFFQDCAKYNATAAGYIGETCRYLLSTPEASWDRNHGVRLMYGNGLRPNVWQSFVDRFEVRNIVEFYAATEGNCNVANMTGKVGSVGFLLASSWPRLMRQRLQPLHLIQVDDVTGEPVRNEAGMCLACEPGQPGELVGEIITGDPTKDFKGYKDNTATAKKILADVFRKGDKYFRSGDILVADEFGNLSFKDRAGDTFRWQGENVSSNEVEGIITNILELKEHSTVYGVEIPDADGRAGMAAIPADRCEDVDLDRLHSGVMEELPKYSRPLFIRIVKEVPMTSTYKLQKHKLQVESFDVTRVDDPIFYLDSKRGRYVRLDRKTYENIMSRSVKIV